MAMKQWIRNNLVLLAGIFLPVLLVIGFMILRGAPTMLGEPSAYDFLLVAWQQDVYQPRDFRLSFEVREGRLHAQAEPLDKQDVSGYRQGARLFRYQAATRSWTELTYDLPETVDTKDGPVSLAIPGAADLRLDKASRSPDGYLFEFAGYSSRGGLLGELFGMGRNYDGQYVLSRDSARFLLPRPDGNPGYYGQDLQFLGWVVDGSAGP